MNNVFFIVGNYGVGKSTVIKEPIISQEGLFIKIKPNLYVLGTDICGADSLSTYKKAFVMRQVLRNKDKNIIITGNYYTQQTDILQLYGHFNLVLIYLDTSFKENAKRIAYRDKVINIDTYNSKLKLHHALIKKTKGYRKLFVIDNDQPAAEVKKHVFNIINDETNRANSSTSQL